MEDFTEVTKDEFYDAMGPLNVHPRIINDKYPYTSVWKIKDSGRVVGKKVSSDNAGGDRYFLKKQDKDER